MFVLRNVRCTGTIHELFTWLFDYLLTHYVDHWFIYIYINLLPECLALNLINVWLPSVQQLPLLVQFCGHEFTRKTSIVSELFAVNLGFRAMMFLAMLLTDSTCALAQDVSSPAYTKVCVNKVKICKSRSTGGRGLCQNLKRTQILKLCVTNGVIVYWKLTVLPFYVSDMYVFFFFYKHR